MRAFLGRYPFGGVVQLVCYNDAIKAVLPLYRRYRRHGHGSKQAVDLVRRCLTIGALYDRDPRTVFLDIQIQARQPSGLW